MTSQKRRPFSVLFVLDILFPDAHKTSAKRSNHFNVILEHLEEIKDLLCII
jgi:hypothetical protein